MSGPTIRRGTPDDAPMLAELAARIFHETFSPHNRPEDMHAYMSEAFRVDRLREELDDAKSCVLLCYVDDSLAGYAKLHWGVTPACVTGERPIELARLYADAPWHGRGIGAALLIGCFDVALADDRRTMWLGVWEHNDRAIAFYRKWGFVECGSHAFWLGSDEQTDVLMTRPLG
jgi:ribosomal protein S18 acetylase RimI-like enzyme